jgi:hypothetical protein
MARRAALRWAPWVLLGACGASVVVVGALAMRGTVDWSSVGLLAVGTSFAIVGAILAARRPGNAIGWLCLALGLTGGWQLAARAYATHGLIDDPGSLPAAQLATWLTGWLATPTIFVLIMLLPLLFPTGKPPSPRWWPVLWLVLVTLSAQTLFAALAPGPFAAAPELVNPIGLEMLDRQYEQDGSMAPTQALLVGLFMTSVLLCVASLVARYRRARGVERQQLKWFYYAFLSVIGIFVVGTSTGGQLAAGDPRESPLNVALWSVVFPATVLIIPISIGIAILRYRLYDIDLIISRTLVYGALTAMLAAAYVGAIAVLQVVLQPFTRGSELAVAASTLVVAALFQPLRAWIQRVVDRRFYRSRYDAERTADAFSARLRDEVNLDTLSRDLLATVAGTVRPARAGLWLRER